MEGFIEWLSKGWFYYGAIFAGVLVLVNSFKLIKEIKDNISKPIKDITSNVSSLTDKVDNLNKRLDTHIKNFEVDHAQQLRSKILEFSDSILVGDKHSKETYDDILAIIDEYDKYCEKHPEFKNHRCTLAVENIQNVYKEKLKDLDFIL